MPYRNSEIHCCDFETTVYEGQETTEVWASASVELNTENVVIFHSIEEQFNYFFALKRNLTIYFHNLKFDGSFIIDYLLTKLDFKLACFKTKPDEPNDTDIEWKDNKFMCNNEFKCGISRMGQWYTITIKVNNCFIEIRDSLKLLPFSLEKIGKSFGTKHKKLHMEYEGYRYAGCEITQEEKKYIANDVLVMKEALEFMFSEGHKKLTIGSCCLSEYKSICKTSMKNQQCYEEMFPDLTEVIIDNEYKYNNADEYIRKSYGGGWCYLVRGKEDRIFTNGTTADVNSLYPSMMHSQSGNYYPVGKPHFWKGDFIPDKALVNNRYYFIRVKTRFKLKRGKLPFLHIKDSFMYDPTENLESSDVYSTKTGMYYTHIPSIEHPNDPAYDESTAHEFTWTMTDYKLVKEHYHLYEFEILDGCWFYTEIGIFDEYIDKFAEIKKKSKGAMRELAKLFLNNLYGKMASNCDSSFKYPYIKKDGIVGFHYVKESNKKAGYIPVGSAITSYARNFTIRAAQKNFHGVDKAGFIYADTDSIHCDLPASEITGIQVHDKDFCCWKLEASWDKAIFVRQKTYIEHVTHENLEPIEEPYFNVKCAGMPERCKELFKQSMTGKTKEIAEYSDSAKVFLFDKDGNIIKRTLADFKVGLDVPEKLLPKRVKGGILLTSTNYKMRELGSLRGLEAYRKKG